jgi:hypothetical protein
LKENKNSGWEKKMRKRLLDIRIYFRLYRREFCSGNILIIPLKRIEETYWSKKKNKIEFEHLPVWALGLQPSPMCKLHTSYNTPHLSEFPTYAPFVST